METNLLLIKVHFYQAYLNKNGENGNANDENMLLLGLIAMQ